MHSVSRARATWATSLILVTSIAFGACGDDDTSGPGADAILGSWQVTSFVQGGVDLVSAGMDLDVILNSGGTYRFEVTNDQLEICEVGVQDCQATGSYSYTATTVTIDDDVPADAVTFAYSISGGDFMTWTGTLNEEAVQIVMQRL
jgi:hypothetical protein